MSLADKQCPACHGGTPPLSRPEIASMLSELPGWELDAASHLKKSIKTKDFQKALDMANVVGRVAEEQQHHPDLLVRWGELNIELWTHAINGLSEADLVLAAKIDRALSPA